MSSCFVGSGSCSCCVFESLDLDLKERPIIVLLLL